MNKAAKNVETGQWIVFGGMAWQAGDVWTEDGTTYIQLGYTVSEFKPNERVTIES
ncbi:hypothetical protein [Streptomyces sp. NPDC094144]|uniref:hypothetical protein n=1 Tax=Streptomyces sp. NPDC094144 TaxID=3366056 RepID=UPI00381E368B